MDNMNNEDEEISEGPLLNVKSYPKYEKIELRWKIGHFDLLTCSPPYYKDPITCSFTVGGGIDMLSKWEVGFFCEDGGLILRLKLLEAAGLNAVFASLDVIIFPYQPDETEMEIKIPPKDYLSEKSIDWTPYLDANRTSINDFRRFLIGDELILDMTFTIYCQSQQIVTTVVEEDGQEDKRLEWDQAHKAVMQDMLESGVNADVIFLTKDGHSIPAHKGILAANSSVFKNIFDPVVEIRKQKKKKYDINDGHTFSVDFDAIPFRMFLNFLYTGKLDEKCRDYCQEIIKAAKEYQIPLLEKAIRCE